VLAAILQKAGNLRISTIPRLLFSWLENMQELDVKVAILISFIKIHLKIAHLVILKMMLITGNLALIVVCVTHQRIGNRSTLIIPQLLFHWWENMGALLA
jgi:hypothetical protein